MKLLVLLVVAVLVPRAQAQEKPQDISYFVPNGWSVERDTVLGLSHFAGRAIILQKIDSVWEEDTSKSTGDWGDEEGQRRLLVLAGEPNGQYSLVAQNDKLLPCAGCGGAHYDFHTLWNVISYKRDQLRIFIDHAPGWEEFVFRYNRHRQNFELTNFNGISVSKGSGDTEDHYVNYLRRKAQFLTGNIESDHMKSRTRTLKKRTLRLLSEADFDELTDELY